MENKEVRLIDARKISNDIALYLAENAYLNDTALDALKMAARWVNEAPTIDPESLRQQWHDAETDPPKEPMEYIVMIKGGANTTTLLYDGGLWFEEDEVGWRTYYKVTHWMPLPKPPKKGD